MTQMTWYACRIADGNSWILNPFSSYQSYANFENYVALLNHLKFSVNDPAMPVYYNKKKLTKMFSLSDTLSLIPSHMHSLHDHLISWLIHNDLLLFTFRVKIKTLISMRYCDDNNNDNCILVSWIRYLTLRWNNNYGVSKDNFIVGIIDIH